MIDFPTVKCLHPKRVLNPYTKELLSVPCGKCRACVLTRQSYLALQCRLESKSNLYSVFVTLTYNNDNVPKAYLHDSLVDPYGYDLVSEDSELLTDVSITYAKKKQLEEKFNLLGAVPYLRKLDLQKFIKRIRYYASKYHKEKLRYFACGEYGPVHFRPHYHLIFYFNDKGLLSKLGEYINKTWTYGYTDAQLVSKDASQYVAGYVNGSCDLPEVFKAPTTRPFVVHSSRLGCKFLNGQCQEVYQTSPTDFIKRCVADNGRISQFNVWRSYYSYFYPKCKGFATKPQRELYDTYTLYATAKKAYPQCETAIEISKAIAYDCYYFGNTSHWIVNTVSDQYCKILCQYFYDDMITTVETDDWSRYVNRIYSELLLSKHFLHNVCSNQTKEEIKKKVGMIQNFYKALEYLHLTEFFESQNKFLTNFLYGTDDVHEDMITNRFDETFYPYFYDNVRDNIAEIETKPCYKIFKSQVEDLFNNRIKHKIQNDNNGIFLGTDV